MTQSPSNNALKMPLTQLGLGFPSVSWLQSDLYAFAVLQILLGGGLSFSVGGPGKGMCVPGDDDDGCGRRRDCSALF